MKFRADVVLVLALLLALAQLFASNTVGPRLGDSSAYATTASADPASGMRPRTAAAQEDNEDNEDDDEDNDNEDDDEDNEDDEDNDDEDNTDDEDNDEDNEDDDNDDADNEDNDNGDGDNDDLDDEDDSANENTDDLADVTPTATPVPPAAPAAAAPPAAAPPAAAPPAAGPPVAGPTVTDVTGVTTGADLRLALAGDRVVVQSFATMPAGITLQLRFVDPLTYAPTPGIRAGDLIFELIAVDATGVPLSALPAEVNLSVMYMDLDVIGLNEPAITMGRLDPVSGEWVTAPKIVAEPTSNYIAASVMDLGVYAVYVP